MAEVDALREDPSDSMASSRFHAAYNLGGIPETFLPWQIRLNIGIPRPRSTVVDLLGQTGPSKSYVEHETALDQCKRAVEDLSNTWNATHQNLDATSTPALHHSGWVGYDL
ncbi:hypothetical protein E4U21_007846 [Claviceps maximensis]|nr:hypothetical protein E4U21_007846 [Claviceps maximensis]